MGFCTAAAGIAVPVTAAAQTQGALISLSGSLFDLRMLLLVGVVCGATVFAAVAGVLFLRAARKARRARLQASENAAEYERKRDFLKAVLAAEPQYLIHWNEAGEPAVVADTLTGNLGIPAELEEVLRFDGWLERDSVIELSSHLEKLRSTGQGFNLMLKSRSGAHIEADGRAAGGGCVLKLRDLAGRRRELAELCDTHLRLGKENAMLRAVLDAVPTPVWLQKPSGEIEWANRAYCRSIEVASPEEAVRQQAALLSSSERAAAQRVLEAGETYHAQTALSVAGEKTQYAVQLRPVGQTCAGIAIETAAAETQPAQERREVSLRFGDHRRILDRIATAIAIFGPDQKLRYFNMAFADLWQLDAGWLKSAPGNGELFDRLRELRRLPEQADYRSWKKEQLDIYQDSGARAQEQWWHLPDGRTLHVVCERAPDGEVTYLFENRTETLSLQSRYNALIHVQKETLDHLGEGVAVFGSDGRLKLFNPAFAAIWQLDPAALEDGPHVDEVIGMCRDLSGDETIWRRVKGAVTSIDDQRERIDGYVERPDGVYLAYAGVPLPDGAMLLTFADVTATKEMERALIQRNEALEEADRLKSAFISHVSYELRTPLTNIIGFSEFLQNAEVGPLNEKQREYLADIRSSSDTLLAIIDDILDLASIDAGGLELKVSEVTADEIINAAVLGVRDRLTRANLRLDIDIAPDTGVFRADVKRLTQVLYNLLSNAIGFSEAGELITLSCRRTGGDIEISVEDRGCGMPEEYKQAAFNRFESDPRGSRHRGPGLGLSIVKNLVELHGGSVHLDSAPNEGTRVTVRIPADGPPKEVQVPDAAE